MSFDVFMMWYQGLDEAPVLVRTVHELWVDQCSSDPNYSLQFLEGSKVDDLISDAGLDPSHLTLQIKSDLVRLHLLSCEGGVWADATIFPTQPLTTWLTPETTGSGFFAFSNSKHDRELSSWFLFAAAQNPAMRGWYSAFCTYLETPRQLDKFAPAWIRLSHAVRKWRAPHSFADPDVYRRARYHPYRIVHYTFGNVLRTDAAAARVWSQTAKWDASDAGMLRKTLKSTSGDHDIGRLVDIALAFPIHKLNWRTAEETHDTVAKLAIEVARRS